MVVADSRQADRRDRVVLGLTLWFPDYLARIRGAMGPDAAYLTCPSITTCNGNHSHAMEITAAPAAPRPWPTRLPSHPGQVPMLMVVPRFAAQPSALVRDRRPLARPNRTRRDKRPGCRRRRERGGHEPGRALPYGAATSATLAIAAMKVASGEYEVNGIGAVRDAIEITPPSGEFSPLRSYARRHRALMWL